MRIERNINERDMPMQKKSLRLCILLLVMDHQKLVACNSLDFYTLWVIRFFVIRRVGDRMYLVLIYYLFALFVMAWLNGYFVAWM